MYILTVINFNVKLEYVQLMMMPGSDAADCTMGHDLTVNFTANRMVLVLKTIFGPKILMMIFNLNFRKQNQ